MVVVVVKMIAGGFDASNASNLLVLRCDVVILNVYLFIFIFEQVLRTCDIQIR